MTYIKEVDGTDQFMDYALRNRICQNKESIQDCRTRSFLKEMFLKCKCVPYEIRDYRKDDECLDEDFCHKLSHLPICLERGRQCYDKLSFNDTDCLSPCTGMFADIQKVTVSNNMWNTKEMTELKQEYEKYRRGHMEPVVYPKELESCQPKYYNFSTF